METEKILAKYPHSTQNILPRHLKSLLEGLEESLSLDGAVVEVGCHAGLTSVYIRRVLDAHKSDKEFHAYDSFCGLPKKLPQDGSGGVADTFVEGYFDLKGTWQIEERFRVAKLKLPILHQGWFIDQTYPDQICFAFLDGDFYSSILDSLNCVWDKVVPGGVVFIHDYGWDALAGVKTACDEFFGEGKVTNLFGMGVIKK